MNNPFSFEKGMELLEQGSNTAKQQLNSTKQAVTGQITGQQPTPQQQNGQPQVLDSVREQIMGKPQEPIPRLDSVHDQLLGESKPPTPSGDLKQQVLGNGEAPKPQAPIEAQQMQQKAQDDLMNAMYGPSNPEQSAPDQQALAAKAKEDQQKQQAIKNQLEYVQREIEQPMVQLRQQRTQQKEEEEKQEEQQKMQELQVEEKKKDDDIAVRRAQNKAEVKGAGAG